jgi:hypothetical protein
MSSRCAAVSVDVDSLYLYYRIHGLDEQEATNAVWEKGVIRFAELFDDLGVKGTFFVVASDLERWPAAHKIARALADAGHEIANHSWSHPYALTQMDRQSITEEIQKAHIYLSELRGRPVSGFRAPGYHISDDVYRVLAQQGYGYSSSLFPSPPYYIAKAAVMGLMRLRGKISKAILGDPRIMVAPKYPHHRRSVLELPITVIPGIRFPLIGTSLMMMGAGGYKLIRPVMRRVSFFNLEFHGIDLCDRDEDGISPFLPQPDLKVPIQKKLAAARTAISDLKAHWDVDTLENLAPRFKGPKAR